MSDLNLLIIVPAFNVGKEIQVVLEKLLPYKKDTIIIDDGSIDTTANVLKKSKFEYLRHKQNLGMGGAIKTGIRHGLRHNYSHAICIDADGQHDPSFIELFQRELKSSDFVMGCRFHAGTVKSIPSPKLSSNFLGATITNAVFGVKIKDTSCGYRGFKLSESYLNIKDNGYGFVFKQLFEVLNLKIKISTIDMPATYPQNSLMCTRQEEIAGFCNTLLPYADKQEIKLKIMNMINSAARKEDFYFTHLNCIFYAYYLERNNSYVIQGGQLCAYDFFSSI